MTLYLNCLSKGMWIILSEEEKKCLISGGSSFDRDFGNFNLKASPYMILQET